MRAITLRILEDFQKFAHERFRRHSGLGSYQKLGVHPFSPNGGLLKKIEEVLLLIAKRYVEWGLGPCFHNPEKNMGRALCSSAPLIPVALRKVTFENF